MSFSLSFTLLTLDCLIVFSVYFRLMSYSSSFLFGSVLISRVEFVLILCFASLSNPVLLFCLLFDFLESLPSFVFSQSSHSALYSVVCLAILIFSSLLMPTVIQFSLHSIALFVQFVYCFT